MFSSTVRLGKIRRPSRTWVIPRATSDGAEALLVSTPPKCTEPFWILPRWKPRSPVIVRSVVVLPAPLGPRRATIDPAATEIDTPLKAEMTS